MTLPPELHNSMSLIIICSVIAYGATEIIKPFLKGVVTDNEKRRATVRLCSVILASIVGFTLGWEWFHLWTGAGAGVLNAYIVKVIKDRLAS